jgi:ATP-dependent Clp protease ATP-binding subunit ClpX
LFICGGAFAGLEDIIGQRVGRKQVGFGAEVRSKTELRASDLFNQVLPEDLMKFGLIPEFIGRLPVVATVEDLDRDALMAILTEPRNALTRQYARMLDMDGVELVFTADALEAIADQAIDRGTGARGLRAILEDVLLGTMFDVPSHPDITKVVVDESVVLGEVSSFAEDDSEERSA